MKRLRSIAGTAGRALSARLSRAGLHVSAVRGPRMEIAGIRMGWGKADRRALPGIVYEHAIAGRTVRFFVHNADDVIQQFHAAGAWFDEPELQTIGRFYKGGTFLDIGANVGNHSLYAALELGAPKVVAFEPTPSAFQICLYNVLLNGLSQRVAVHPLGLSDARERASAQPAPARNSGATSLRIAASGELELRRGDDEVGDEPIGFIKIDVEGAEMRVLAGLERTIRTNRPVMHVEVDPQNRDAFATYCKDKNYRVADIVERAANANLVIVPEERS
jgi:FkbM family methyltransferase